LHRRLMASCSLSTAGPPRGAITTAREEDDDDDDDDPWWLRFALPTIAVVGRTSAPLGKRASVSSLQP